ncbi:D-alanine--D-alanine ligase [Acetobacter sp. AN02]|uniref:D-alanine--D-alanine ligase n=1 Tax=Acetobacter sp. AN02 TaxID=2894186 RepID=UPI0024341A1F|nr:D-alanine--D-alanine ligase [Acetobacter sp. AN02]MDG6093777.1 D-alanine--D-alanine ligase [Acetobacter sp. AN02]
MIRDSAVTDGNAADGTSRTVSFFEFWPGWAFYTPIVVWWILLGFRFRDMSLPTIANPHIPTGGLCGESKSDILAQAGQVARQWIAPWTVMRTGRQDGTRARAAMAEAGLSFPVVVKPDIGCNGTGVRLVQADGGLDEVLASFPRDVDLVLQRLIPYEHEAGVFYIRHPQKPRGEISSLTIKLIPSLTGDGRSSVRELLHADPRTGLLTRLYEPRLGDRLETVPAKGEVVPLVFTGNHCKGAVFVNGEADITPELAARIDSIMQDFPEFYFGRIDLKFRSPETLRRGEEFEIIEINGVGAEATHIWDARTTLREAWITQFRHYYEAFVIGAENRRRGWKPTGVWHGVKLWQNQKRLMRSYPLND